MSGHVRVTTGSRLHFGLLNPGGGQRRFGGVGLMVERPGVQVAVQPAQAWSATGPCAERALAFANTFAKSAAPRDSSAFSIGVERCAPEHAGLGTGTQLALAIARGIAQCLGITPSSIELAGTVNRGARSALGIHGFERGGLIVDGGKVTSTAIAPLIAHYPFPQDWKVLLIIPHRVSGEHGKSEQDAFEQLIGRDMSSNAAELS